MAIVNIVPYFNEEIHLLLRIDCLLDSLDRLIICEADRTYTGIEKGYTCEEMLDRRGISTDKITVVRVRMPSAVEEPDHWVRERMQRNAGIPLVTPDDVVISSDCDEIPRKDVIPLVAEMVRREPDVILGMAMTIHNSRADLVVTLPFCDNDILYTFATFACSAEVLSRTDLSRIREVISYDEKNSGLDVRTVDVHCGWHFTWMGSPEDRITKLRSFAHANEEVPMGVGWLDSDHAAEFVRNYRPAPGSTDTLGREYYRMERYSIESLPPELLSNREFRRYYLPDIREHLYS